MDSCISKAAPGIYPQIRRGKNELEACSLLSTIRPSQTLLPATPEYERARAAYWSQTQWGSTPAVIFQAETAADVSIALIVLRKTSCPFAVKSGGHGKWPGESSINNGVLIDLAKMNQIKLSKDRSTVEIGPANHWIDVYSALEPLGLTVVGGRAAGVGVGGFLLGGGISWFSNLYGWGCDNITAYEVVLTDGSIVTADKDSFQDLYKGLRGGAGNLGVVTTFHVRAHPYTGMFAGHKAFDNRYGDEATKAFIDIGRISDHEDRKCFYLLSLNAENNVWQWGATVAYCDAIVNPPCLQASNDIPSLVDDCKLRHQTESVIQLQAQYPVWLQCGIWTFATQVDLKTLRICCEIWKEEMKPVIDEVEGFMPILAVQYMSAAVIENAGRDGGNVTGLAGTRPFILYNSEPRWSNARDNTRVSIGINKAFQRMSVEATLLGTNHKYRYSNYASEYQDPISSYGVGPNEFLRKVSRKYDPDGILQTLRSSGFNFSGAPRRIQELDPCVKL